MTLTEALDVTRIYSVADMLPSDTPSIRMQPCRAPHHTISHAALRSPVTLGVGGGTWPRPGEISLAHRGVLFLGEMPEFSQHVLECTCSGTMIGRYQKRLSGPLLDRMFLSSENSGVRRKPEANLRPEEHNCFR